MIVLNDPALKTKLLFEKVNKIVIMHLKAVRLCSPNRSTWFLVQTTFQGLIPSFFKFCSLKKCISQILNHVETPHIILYSYVLMLQNHFGKLKIWNKQLLEWGLHRNLRNHENIPWKWHNSSQHGNLPAYLDKFDWHYQTARYILDGRNILGPSRNKWVL